MTVSEPNRADILIDADVCQGLGYCERISGHIFQVSDELGISQAPETVVGEENVRAAVAAEEICPTRAISLRLYRE